MVHSRDMKRIKLKPMRHNKLTLLILMMLVSLSHMCWGQEVRMMTLRECIDVAIENNLNVKRARLSVEGSKVNLSESRASRLPNANVNWNYGINWGRSIDPTTNQFTTDQINSSGLGATSNVILFNGLRQYHTVIQGKTNQSVAEADLEDQINIVSLNIGTFYLNVIFNRELAENARFQLESSESQLARTKLLVQSGAAPRTQELELISQVASNEVALINAQNNLDLALLDLKQAMLIPASERIDIVIPNIDLDGEPDLGITSQEVYDDALVVQPNIRSADLSVQAAQYGVKVAEGGRYPTVSFGGSYNTNYSSGFDDRPVPTNRIDTVLLPTVFTTSGERILSIQQGQDTEEFRYFDQFQENRRWNFGVGINIPIFNGLQVNSQIQRSKIQLQQAEISAVEQRNFLRQQIESAYADALAASKTFAASTRQVEALQETFRSIENQYNLGAANFTDYQVASNNLFQARSDLVRAKYDFIFRKKILDFYQGKPITLE